MSRYACYLIAQNGDSNKEQIAFAQITNFNIQRDDLRSESTISQERVKNHRDVRKLLTDRGIVPERLPPAEDIKKVKRRIQSEERKLPKQADKLEQKSTDENEDAS